MKLLIRITHDLIIDRHMSAKPSNKNRLFQNFGIFSTYLIQEIISTSLLKDTTSLIISKML